MTHEPSPAPGPQRAIAAPRPHPPHAHVYQSVVLIPAACLNLRRCSGVTWLEHQQSPTCRYCRLLRGAYAPACIRPDQGSSPTTREGKLPWHIAQHQGASRCCLVKGISNPRTDASLYSHMPASLACPWMQAVDGPMDLDSHKIDATALPKLHGMAKMQAALHCLACLHAAHQWSPARPLTSWSWRHVTPLGRRHAHILAPLRAGLGVGLLDSCKHSNTALSSMHSITTARLFCIEYKYSS